MEERNKISGILDSEEQHDLLGLLKDDGWKSVMKLADAILLDWAEQGMNPDMAKLSDSEIGKHLAKFHGMKKGLVSFLTALEHWKRSEENRAELPTED